MHDEVPIQAHSLNFERPDCRRKSWLTVIIGVACFATAAARLVLGLYCVVAIRDDLVPSQTAAMLDEQGRRDALELCKHLLPVVDVPYRPLSAETQIPFSDDAHQRRIETEFRDAESGMVIRAQTHLCLPGVDACISGGIVSVSDELGEWRITFQLLGSKNPSAFQSSLPRSRELLNRLRSRIRQLDAPTQQQYASALRDVLDAEDRSAVQQDRIQRLLDLLLASFFSSDEYARTVDLAEAYRLFD